MRGWLGILGRMFYLLGLDKHQHTSLMMPVTLHHCIYSCALKNTAQSIHVEIVGFSFLSITYSRWCHFYISL